MIKNNAKRTKIALMAMLIFLFLLIPGELYQSYLDQFDDFYHVTFYPQNNTDYDKMKADIKRSATQHNVQIFKIESEKSSESSSKIQIYADTDVKKYLEKQFNIKEGNYISVLAGSTKVSVEPFADMPASSVMNNNEYCLLGNLKDMRAFRSELADKYPGAFPKKDGYNDLSEKKSFLLMATALFALILMVLCIFDINSQRRENFLLFSIGMSPLKLYLRNIVQDTVSFSVVFVLGYIIVNKVEHNLPFAQNVVVGIIVLICVDILMMLGLLRNNHKVALSNIGTGQKSLRLCYAAKIVTTALMLIVVSSNVTIASDILSYYKQEPFFEKHKDYEWISSIYSDDDMDSEEAFTVDMFNNHKDDINLFYLTDCAELNDADRDFFLEASKNTMPYLKEKIKLLNNCKVKKSEDYLLIPKGCHISEEDIEHIKSYSNYEKIRSFTYDEDISVVFRKFGGQDSSSIVESLLSEAVTEECENPVILLHSDDMKIGQGYFRYEISLAMINDKDNVLHGLSQKYNCKLSTVNVYDSFKYQVTFLSRTLLINIMLAVLILLLEIIMTATLIRIDFSANMIEHAMKKTMGESLLKRYGKTYLMTAISIAAAFCAYIAYCILTGVSISAGIIICVICLIIVEFIINVGFSAKVDRQNILKVLKGGVI